MGIYEHSNRHTARAAARWPRTPRTGRPDGTSVTGRYIVRWQDEDAGWQSAGVTAASPEAAIAALAHLIPSTARAYPA